MIAALVQMFCKWGDRDCNLDRVSHYCREAKSTGVELIVFPELTVTEIYKDEKLWELAETSTGPSMRFLCNLAGNNGLAIGAGFSEKTEASHTTPIV